ARLAIIERDIHVAGAAENREPLLSHDRGTRRKRCERPQLRERVQERAPAEVRSRELGGRAVALDVRRGPRAAGIATLVVVVVAASQRACQQRLFAPREAKLGELGDAPLSQRHSVLRVLARRHRKVGERGKKRRRERAQESRVWIGCDRYASGFAQREAVPQPPDGER